MSKREIAVSSIFKYPREDRVFSISSLGRRAISDADWPDAEKDRYLDSYGNSILNRVEEIQDRLLRSGLARQFIVVDRKKLLIRWPSVSKDGFAKNSFLRSLNIPTAMQFLDALSADDYEYLGGAVCSMIGASKIKVTKSSGDGGIDFLAVIPAYTKTPLICSGERGLRIIGQSKKWTSSVGEGQLKQLAHTVNEITCRAPKHQPNIPTWFYDSGSPIVPWVLGFQGFERGARTFAKDNGYVISDRYELAFLLADPKFYRIVSPDIPREVFKAMQKIRDSEK